MNLNIISKSINDLLSREEIKADLEFDKSTPSRNDIKKEIARKLNAKEDLVVVKNIHNKFGTRTAYVYARVYKDADSMKSTESGKLLARQAPKKDATASTAEEKKQEPEKDDAA